MTVLDAMILIAILAVSLSASIAYFNDNLHQFLLADDAIAPDPLSVLRVKFRIFMETSNLFLSGSSIGLLAMNFRHPRPSPRNLLLRAGTAPLAVAVFLWILNVCAHWVIYVVRLHSGRTSEPWSASAADLLNGGLTDLHAEAGPMIAFAWTILALCRMWRCRGWLDVAGIAVGACWIIVSLANFLDNLYC